MTFCTPRRVATALLSLGLVSAAPVALAQPAGAANITVGPGQSIQAALDAAPPGSTIRVLPGTYRENVAITKDAITLRGAGPGLTVLLPPATPQPNACLDPQNPGDVNGICVIAPLDQNGNPVGFVNAPRITGFSVRNFPSIGVVFLGVRGGVVDGVVATGNGSYGITAFSSTGSRFTSNVASGSGEAGFYVGDSPSANATVSNNTSYDNQFGIFIRSASVGTVTRNNVHDNCAGIFLLTAPNPPTGWLLSGNTINHNDRVCPGGEESRPLSGIGIVLLGAQRNTIRANTVNDNAPGGLTAGSGGVILLRGAAGNIVSANNAHRNVPADLLDQSGAPNSFIANRCERSDPPGLCPGGASPLG